MEESISDPSSEEIVSDTGSEEIKSESESRKLPSAYDALFLLRDALCRGEHVASNHPYLEMDMEAMDQMTSGEREQYAEYLQVLRDWADYHDSGIDNKDLPNLYQAQAYFSLNAREEIRVLRTVRRRVEQASLSPSLPAVG